MMELYEQLREELDLIADYGTLPVKRLAAALAAIAITKTKLNAYLKARADLELDFYKRGRPLVWSEHWYVIAIFTLETSRPVGDLSALRNYYEAELLEVQYVFKRYQFLYNYFKAGRNSLDQMLFVGGSGCSDVFARFIAAERLQEYILNELKTL